MSLVCFGRWSNFFAIFILLFQLALVPGVSGVRSLQHSYYRITLNKGY